MTSGLGRRYLDTVNRTPADPDLLGEVMRMHATMNPDDRRESAVRMFHLFELLKARGYQGDAHTNLALSIEWRLSALARLVSEQGVIGWTAAGDDGAELLHPNVVMAAATEPLTEGVDGQAVFDPIAFRERCFGPRS